MSPWAHFTEYELRCRCGYGCGLGPADMDDRFMRMLVRLRLELGIPFPVTSAIRCANHDRDVSVSISAGEGPHTTGCAADISTAGMTGEQVRDVLSGAMRAGFKGIGMRAHGPHDQRFIHLDTLKPFDGWPRPAVWTYA